MIVTQLFNPMFAEVSDKIPTLPLLWLYGILAAILVGLICRLLKPAIILCIPLLAWIAVSWCGEFFTDVRSAVVQERRLYLVQVLITSAFPLVVVLACGFFWLRDIMHRRRGVVSETNA